MRLPAAGVLAIALAVMCSPAQAFDTGPHADMTRDAMTAEGATPGSASIAAVNNWFVDYYTNPDKNPYSGHANFLIGVTRLGIARESWPDFWVESARRLHFDAERRQAPMPDLSNTAGIDKEWQRLMWIDAVPAAELRQAEEQPAPRAGHHRHHAARGAGLLRAQQLGRGPVSGARAAAGPGLARSVSASHPTWFDVPPEVRQARRQRDGLHRRQGHPSRPRPLAVRQEQVAVQGPQQGLDGPAEVPRGLHHRLLRHPAVAPGDADLAGQRAAVEAGDVMPNTGALTHDVPARRRSPSSAAIGTGAASRAFRSVAATAPARPAASSACACARRLPRPPRRPRTAGPSTS